MFPNSEKEGSGNLLRTYMLRSFAHHLTPLMIVYDVRLLQKYYDTLGNFWVQKSIQPEMFFKRFSLFDSRYQTVDVNGQIHDFFLVQTETVGLLHQLIDLPSTTDGIRILLFDLFHQFAVGAVDLFFS